jgi:hypothetical protein
MKKALIDKRFWEVAQLVKSDEETFETTSDFIWMDCPDNVEDAWHYDPDTGEFIDPHAASKDEFGNPVEPFTMQRMRAYPPMGDQMDMLFKEIAATGSISTNGEWFKSIQFVKTNVPKPGVAGDPGISTSRINPYRAKLDGTIVPPTTED